MENESFFVYINGRLKMVTSSTKSAWECIGNQPLGSLYEVLDADGNTIQEFVPF